MADSGQELIYHITQEDDGIRLRSIVTNRIGISRSLLQKLIREDRITLNGRVEFLNQFARAGDTLNIDLYFEEQSAILPEPMHLDIVYEDTDFVVINKPPGVLVHPVGKEQSGTLANGVVYHWLQHNFYAKFRPIHRLDRNTSGLVVVGKNQFAHQALYKQFHRGGVYREYLALAHGVFANSNGTITAPIARKPGSIVERMISPEGQAAVTHYRVIRTFANMTLVSLVLETGRTHQIRIHLQHLGHPLLGDTLYCGSDKLIHRQALHSHVFEFVHPRHGKPVGFEAALANDMAKLIESAQTN